MTSLAWCLKVSCELDQRPGVNLVLPIENQIPIRNGGDFVFNGYILDSFTCLIINVPLCTFATAMNFQYF